MFGSHENLPKRSGRCTVPTTPLPDANTSGVLDRDTYSGGKADGKALKGKHQKYDNGQKYQDDDDVSHKSLAI